jgi:hypothetical protein
VHDDGEEDELELVARGDDVEALSFRGAVELLVAVVGNVVVAPVAKVVDPVSVLDAARRLPLSYGLKSNV